jgi:hypothetical protein
MATALHRFSYEFQSGLVISALAYITLKHLTFVIYSTPKVVPFAVDLHKDFI